VLTPARLLVLSRLAVRLQEASDETAVFRALAAGLRELALAGFVGRLEPDGREVRVVAAGAEAAPPRGRERAAGEAAGRRVAVEASPLIARVIRSREAVFLSDPAEELGAILPEPAEAGPTGGLRAGEAAICAPMVSRGRAAGLLIVVGGELEEADGAAIRALADQLAVSLENLQILGDLKQTLLREHAAARELRRLEALVAELSVESEPRSLLRRIVNATIEALDVERVALFLVDEAEAALLLAESSGLSAGLSQGLQRLPLGPAGGSLARALDGGLTVVVDDLRRAVEWAPFRAASDAAGLRSLWAVPLLSRQGDRLGVLAIFSERPGRPDPEQLELAERYAHHAALAISSGRRQERETLAARVEAMLELARAIPHEVGQPLAIINGYAELIAEGRLRGARLREACREMVEASASLAELVRRLERIRTYVTKEFGPGRRIIDIERASEEEPG
jgi:GAF domain-containing protein